MFCAKCGKPLDEGTRFCLSCGAVQEIVDIEPESDSSESNEELDEGVFSGKSADLTDSADSSDSSELDFLSDFDESGNDDPERSPEPEQTERSVPTLKPTVARPEKHRRKPMSAAPTALICVVFSILTLVLTLSSTTLWETRNILQNSSVSTAAAQMNPLYLKAKDAIKDTAALEKALADSGIAEVEIGEIGEDETLGDVIERTFVKYGVTEDEAEQFLEKSALMPYLTEVVSAYESFLLTGEDAKPVTDKKLKETALNCMDYASKELGFKFRPDSEQRLDDFFKKNKDEIRALNPSEALGVGGSYIRYWFSLPVIITAAVLVIAAAALAGVITRRFDAAFITLGIPMALSGTLFLYIGLFPKLALEQAHIPSAAIGDSVETLGASFIQAGAIEAVIGVVFIAAFIVYRVLAAKLTKKKELQNA